MRRIELKSMKLNHFKGINSLDVVFNGDVTVQADNGYGKSTVFDAFAWLTTGKDSLNQAEFEIKTLTEDNKVIPNVDHSVECVISIDGNNITLKKNYKEVWTKPRGEEFAKLTGHETICTWDLIPVSITEFKKRIQDIIPEHLFKLITNPMYFSSLKDNDKRQILVSMAGDVETRLYANPEFADIVAKLDGKSISDYRAKLKADKKVIKDETKSLPTVIETLANNKPEACDEVETKAAIKLLQDKSEAIRSKGQNEIERVATANESITKQISDLKVKNSQLLTEAKQKEADRVDLANQSYYDTQREYKAISSKYDLSFDELNTLSTSVTKIEADIEKKRAEVVTARSNWSLENAKTFKVVPHVTCPVYGHICQDEDANVSFSNNQNSTLIAFDTAKADTLKDIKSKGAKLNEEIVELEKKLAIEKENKIKCFGERNKLFEDKNAKNEIFSKMKLDTPNEIKTTDEIQSNFLKITELETNKTVSTTSDDDNERIIKITEEIKEFEKKLHNNEIIVETDSKIEVHEKELLVQSQMLADLERIEFKLEALSKARMELVSEAINSKFKFVKFKLFDIQIGNGNEVDVCETLVNGVPYISLNTASRVNAGLDIINALSNHYQIQAPVFIDNRETTNSIIPVESQTFNLFVTKDKQLLIN